MSGPGKQERELKLGWGLGGRCRLETPWTVAGGLSVAGAGLEVPPLPVCTPAPRRACALRDSSLEIMGGASLEASWFWRRFSCSEAVLEEKGCWASVRPASCRNQGLLPTRAFLLLIHKINAEQNESFLNARILCFRAASVEVNTNHYSLHFMFFL